MSGSLSASIFVAFYGDHPDLCRRFLARLYRHTPTEGLWLRVGLNEVCQETVDVVEAASREFGNIGVHSEPRNVFKCPLMAKLFAFRPIETEWVVWFDDDSYPYRDDWLPGLKLRMEVRPEVDVWGNPFFTEADEAAVQFIRSADWYRGVPFDHRKPSGERTERPLLSFVEGGFWAARTRVIRELGWPDRRLVQNEEDYMFGEALRQNGFKIGRYKSGVRINEAERRCPQDTPRSYGLPARVEV